ncbi:unnamed protein product [Nippostrongylus brasiliensis]|uniref:Uncharacterized protein n=1 Tax=Nippostrongylus brasiliensis TaxID=27835 RepID=A0A0N4YNP6_NIPBR|nr:unnamed protein product [Nippostrongylus brasiliensis]
MKSYRNGFVKYPTKTPSFAANGNPVAELRYTFWIFLQFWGKVECTAHRTTTELSQSPGSEFIRNIGKNYFRELSFGKSESLRYIIGLHGRTWLMPDWRINWPSRSIDPSSGMSSSGPSAAMGGLVYSFDARLGCRLLFALRLETFLLFCCVRSIFDCSSASVKGLKELFTQAGDTLGLTHYSETVP